MTTELGAHRRIETYLDDLARMLAGADPALRAEVLGGVREHVEAALEGPGETSEADVDAILAELGPPEAVAAAAMEGESASAREVVVPVLDRSWVPPTVGMVLLVTMGLHLLGLAGSAWTFVTTAESSRSSISTSGGFHAPEVGDFAPLLPASYDIAWSALAPLLMMALPWLLSMVLLAASRLWTTRQTWVGALLVPGSAVLNGLGLALVLGLGASATVGGAVLVTLWLATACAAALVVTRLWRAGSRRARTAAGLQAGPGPATPPQRSRALLVVIAVIVVLLLVLIFLPALIAVLTYSLW